VDLDVAGEPEIEALRGIGPSLARRIVADRDSFGPFGSLEGFKRVRGVGDGLVAKLDTTVTFSLLPRPMNTVVQPSRHRPKKHVRDTLN
jgi:competence protein ComEA